MATTPTPTPPPTPTRESAPQEHPAPGVQTRPGVVVPPTLQQAKRDDAETVAVSAEGKPLPQHWWEPQHSPIVASVPPPALEATAWGDALLDQIDLWKLKMDARMALLKRAQKAERSTATYTLQSARVRLGQAARSTEGKVARPGVAAGGTATVIEDEEGGEAKAETYDDVKAEWSGWMEAYEKDLNEIEKAIPGGPARRVVVVPKLERAFDDDRVAWHRYLHSLNDRMLALEMLARGPTQ
jgi:hypothetical protein